MRKITLVNLICLFVASIVYGATINVPSDHSTIQAAHNAASSGDTIRVADGTYREQITITKSNLTFESVNPRGAKIDGGGFRDYGFFANGSVVDITIDGFDIFGQDQQGIRMDSRSTGYRRWEVMNNDFHDIWETGILVRGNDHAIHHNQFYMIGNAVEAMGIKIEGNDSEIHDNTIYAIQKQGIRSRGTGNVIFDNVVYFANNCIGSNTSRGGNTFRNNLVYNCSEGLKIKHTKGLDGREKINHNTVLEVTHFCIQFSVNDPVSDDLEAKNNVCVLGTKGTNPRAAVGDVRSRTSDAEIDGNLYDFTGSIPFFRDDGDGTVSDSLSDFRSDTTYGDNAIVADAGIVSYEDGIVYAANSRARSGSLNLGSPLNRQLGAHDVEPLDRARKIRMLRNVSAVSASSDTGDIDKLTDGQRAGLWSPTSHSGNVVFSLDGGDEASFDVFSFQNNTKSRGSVKAFRLQTGDSATGPWTTVLNVGSDQTSEAGGRMLFSAPDTSARFVRFIYSDIWENDLAGPKIVEVFFFSFVEGSSSPTPGTITQTIEAGDVLGPEPFEWLATLTPDDDDVEFLIDDVVVNFETSDPYGNRKTTGGSDPEYDGWNDPLQYTPGEHTFTVRKKNEGTTNTVTATIRHPVIGQYVTINDEMVKLKGTTIFTVGPGSFNWLAKIDPDDDEVEFLIDGTLVDTVSSAPYMITVDPSTGFTAGEHTLLVRKKASPTTSVSSAITFRHSGELTQHAVTRGQRVNLGDGTKLGPEPFQWTVALDPDDDDVEFLIDNTLIDTDDTAPYTITVNPTTGFTAGTHTLVARKKAERTSISVTVTFVHPGEISQRAVVNGQTVTLTTGRQLGPESFQWVATLDPDDDEVEFLIDAVLIDTVSNSPYEITINPTTQFSEGEHTLLVRKKDEGTSNSVVVSFVHPGQISQHAVINDEVTALSAGINLGPDPFEWVATLTPDDNDRVEFWVGTVGGATNLVIDNDFDTPHSVRIDPKLFNAGENRLTVRKVNGRTGTGARITNEVVVNFIHPSQISQHVVMDGQNFPLLRGTILGPLPFEWAAVLTPDDNDAVRFLINDRAVATIPGTDPSVVRIIPSEYRARLDGTHKLTVQKVNQGTMNSVVVTFTNGIVNTRILEGKVVPLSVNKFRIETIVETVTE